MANGNLRSTGNGLTAFKLLYMDNNIPTVFSRIDRLFLLGVTCAHSY